MQFPQHKVNVSVFLGSGAATSGGSASGRATVSLPPNASLEERVDELERVQGLYSALIRAIQDRIDEGVHVRASELESERSERAVEDKNLLDLLKKASAGGLHLAEVGVVWLFVGLIFGTASTEIAKFLGPR
jgi:hypothetical protein